MYNEVLYDLLTSKDREQSVVELRESGNSLVIPGLTQKAVKSAEQAMDVLNEVCTSDHRCRFIFYFKEFIVFLEKLYSMRIDYLQIP